MRKYLIKEKEKIGFKERQLAMPDWKILALGSAHFAGLTAAWRK
jgi:hypothetical protein